MTHRDDVISTHYLKRRATAHAAQIREWQAKATTTADLPSQARLDALGVGWWDPIRVEKKGKWDARYSVVVA